MSDNGLATNIAAQWIIDPGAQASLANQLFVQFDSTANPAATQPDGVYLTFGHVNPPVFTLPPGEQPTPEMLEGLVLPVMPVARVHCSFERLKAFAAEINARIAEAEQGTQA